MSIQLFPRTQDDICPPNSCASCVSSLDSVCNHSNRKQRKRLLKPGGGGNKYIYKTGVYFKVQEQKIIELREVARTAFLEKYKREVGRERREKWSLLLYSILKDTDRRQGWQK